MFCAPAYVAAILWLLSGEGVRSIDVAAGGALALAFAGWLWGVWRWTGLAAWAARIVACLALAFGAPLSIQLVLLAAPFVLFALRLNGRVCATNTRGDLGGGDWLSSVRTPAFALPFDSPGPIMCS